MSNQQPEPEFWPISEAPTRVKKICGYEPHPSTTRRWVSHGLADHGPRLETISVGRRRFCSDSFLAEFITKTSSAFTPTGEPGKYLAEAPESVDDCSLRVASETTGGIDHA